MAQFPVLYGTAMNGRSKQWSIEVEEIMGSAALGGAALGGAIIRTSHGYEGGKIQVTEKQIAVGKNIGKKNETSAVQQAISEAQSAWQKKCDEKYAPRDTKKRKPIIIVDDDAATAATAATVNRNAAVDDSVPSPMLAHDYNKRGRSIIWPCYVQPKFDGTRMVGISHQGLYSRNRKAYPHLEHIRAELVRLPPGTVLDGELYSTTLTFQEIVGLVKNETIQPNQEEIKFFVYDMITDQNYETRHAMLNAIFSLHTFQHLVLVKTEACANEAAMKEKHAEYVADGYEGIMLRNKTGLYSNCRSVHLQKYKEFFDEECKIIGFKEGEGVEAGCVIWICETSDGKSFSCRPRGSREERQTLFQTGDAYVGKMLTVRYQEKTDDGLLRFPVGIAIRDYE